ncbi:hypothetical protein YC2023_006340 [Brassica napus]
MGNLSESFDIEDLMSYGDDLISLLNAKNGFEVVSQSFEDLKALRFVCDEDLNQTQRSIQDCKKKLVACKKKTEEASCGDDDVERLQRELDEEIEIECKLKDELR